MRQFQIQGSLFNTVFHALSNDHKIKNSKKLNRKIMNKKLVLLTFRNN